MSDPVTVHLVDASPYVFRAWFAMPDSIRTPEGRPVNAVRGFASFLLKLLVDESPTHLGIAFDESLTTSFRNDFFPGYKASRELPPVELEDQFRDCVEVARAFGTATYASSRYEADDLVGTLCGQLVAAGHGAVVLSSDKDLAQLVSERVTLFDFAKDRRLGPAEVLERFGVRPEQIPDYLGLVGDAVDDIPGIPGVGAKTAAALLQAHATIEDLYEHLDDVATLPIRGAASLRRKLDGRREEALLSKRLATIAADAPVEADVEELAWRGVDRSHADPLFDRLGFGRLGGSVRFTS